MSSTTAVVNLTCPCSSRTTLAETMDPDDLPVLAQHALFKREMFAVVARQEFAHARLFATALLGRRKLIRPQLLQFLAAVTGHFANNGR